MMMAYLTTLTPVFKINTFIFKYLKWAHKLGATAYNVCSFQHI